jgi:hypothetical protein
MDDPLPKFSFLSMKRNQNLRISCRAILKSLEYRAVLIVPNVCTVIKNEILSGALTPARSSEFME